MTSTWQGAILSAQRGRSSVVVRFRLCVSLLIASFASRDLARASARAGRLSTRAPLSLWFHYSSDSPPVFRKNFALCDRSQRPQRKPPVRTVLFVQLTLGVVYFLRRILTEYNPVSLLIAML